MKFSLLASLDTLLDRLWEQEACQNLGPETNHQKNQHMNVMEKNMPTLLCSTAEELSVFFYTPVLILMASHPPHYHYH